MRLLSETDMNTIDGGPVTAKRGRSFRLARYGVSACGVLLAATAACGGSGNSDAGGSFFDSGTPEASSQHDATTEVGADTSTTTIGGGLMDTGTPEACASSSQTAHVSPLDIFILLDRSGSMAENDSWDQEVMALDNFIGDSQSAGIGVALQYMPLNALCDVSAYATPAVPISLLPLGAGPLITSLGNSRPFGGTPTTVALEGAIQYAQARQKAYPERDIVIVLSTDGLPDSSCSIVPPDGGLPNSTQNAIAVLQAASSATPPIKTFVIGVGNEPSLNAFATAGGTNSAIFVGASDAGTSVDIEGEITSAISAIRTKALPCAYNIPQLEGGAINFGEVNVTFTPGSGAKQQFFNVPDATQCQTTTNDWYYNSTMTQIELCPTACSEVKASTNGTFDVAYGCATMEAPK